MARGLAIEPYPAAKKILEACHSKQKIEEAIKKARRSENWHQHLADEQAYLIRELRHKEWEVENARTI